MTIKTLFILLMLMTLNTFAQDVKKQELGINMAGVFIKNEASIMPSFFYKYKINNYQLRFQLAMNGLIDSKDREGTFTQDSPFSNFLLDTVIDYEPGKTVKYGFILGVQKNTFIENSPFSYFIGLDALYLVNEFSRKGSGQVAQGNGGQDTTKFRSQLKVSDKQRVQIYGLAIPMGIQYIFYKNFFVSVEARLLFAYQKITDYHITEQIQIQQGQEFITTNKGDTKNKAFDFGLKPVAGVTLGIRF